MHRRNTRGRDGSHSSPSKWRLALAQALSSIVLTQLLNAIALTVSMWVHYGGGVHDPHVYLGQALIILSFYSSFVALVFLFCNTGNDSTPVLTFRICSLVVGIIFFWIPSISILSRKQHNCEPDCPDTSWRLLTYFAPIGITLFILGWGCNRRKAWYFYARTLWNNDLHIIARCLVLDMMLLSGHVGLCTIVLYARYGSQSPLAQCRLSLLEEDKWTLGQVFAIVTSLSPLYSMVESLYSRPEYYTP